MITTVNDIFTRIQAMLGKEIPVELQNAPFCNSTGISFPSIACMRVNDIFTRIQAMLGKEIPVELQNAPFQFYLSITDDLVTTGERNMSEHGIGFAAIFPVQNREHGITLIEQVYSVISKDPPPVEVPDIDSEEDLSLFIYMVPGVPKAYATKATVTA